MVLSRLARAGLTSNSLILLVAAFLVAFGNGALFANVLKTYPLTGGNALPLLSLIPVFGGAIVLLLAPVCFRRATKPVLIVVLLLSSLAAYFMDNYGVVINDEMLRNAALTHAAEVRDLLNLKLLAYVALLGILPSIAVYRLPVRWRGWRRELVARLTLVGITLAMIVGPGLVFGGFYASFVREHKMLRYYANPTYYVYSALRYGGSLLATRSSGVLTRIGLGSKVPDWDTDRDLIILVIGETARADRFSLNGYPRETNPLLKKAGVISFTNFWACGTSTAASLPCIFSVYGEAAAGSRKEATSENLMDILQRSGINALWLENNSDSKGVALRVPYEDYRSPQVNPVCDVECRDEGMISAVQPFIDAHPKGDIFIVMHQMGNHGPAYYLRYPPAFEKFTPACKTNEINRCSRAEINNAYDNAILYTDYFLSRVIERLEKNSSKFDAALFYVSDHGESLGEDGIYLHGYPKMLAPKEQLHVPAIMWFARNYDDVDVAKVRAKQNSRFTHDSVFHTVLGLLEIESSVYRPELDIVHDAWAPGKGKMAGH